MSVQIIVDSTADLTPALKNQVKVVPLTVHFGEEAYIDGITITHQEFYEKLTQSDVLPSTSQATPATFADVFETVGADGAVVLTIASQLSGTYQSATIGAADFDNIYVVDTGSVTIGAGILAELALQLSEAGLSAKEIAEQLEQAKEKVQIVAILDTLEYLKRGGRISKTVAFAGGLLNIKPVISIADGQIQMLGKARGTKQGNQLLLQEVEKAGGVDFSRPVLLGYTGLSDELLLKFKEGNQPMQALQHTIIGSVVGTHAGPGAVAIAFFKQ